MKILIFVTFISISFFPGCSSSTSTRYDKEDEDKTTVTEEDAREEKKEEVFDMTPYHSTFDFNLREQESTPELWYGYDSSSIPGKEKITTLKAGYRVEVLVTDNLDEANNVRSELRFKLKQNIYIVFDPPFYRVRVGDYGERNSAENQTFKLKQIGYNESRVVSDSVKVTEFK